MCQQRYIERYEYEVEEATGKRKREGKKLWVPYPAVSVHPDCIQTSVWSMSSACALHLASCIVQHSVSYIVAE